MYCHRVASVVGQACIHIWGFQGEEAIKLAAQCGIAFQLTNILRDLGEDAAGGRLYLPHEDLRRFSYTVNDLSRGVVDERFAALVRYEVSRAEEYYRAALRLEQYLHADGRAYLLCNVPHVSSAVEESCSARRPARAAAGCVWIGGRNSTPPRERLCAVGSARIRLRKVELPAYELWRPRPSAMPLDRCAWRSWEAAWQDWRQPWCWPIAGL